MRPNPRRLLAQAFVFVLLSGCHATPPVADVAPGEVARAEAIVRMLADPATGGRGAGSPGLADARDFILGRFVQLGLDPAFADGQYVQRVAVTQPGDSQPTVVENVAAALPGRGRLAYAMVIVCAHYDHLPAVVTEEARSTVFPGADDNASGVAAMLLTAEHLAGGLGELDAGADRRTIVFVAFSGEEAGMLGSRHFVRHAEALPWPMRSATGVINLDMVGRLAGSLQVLTAGDSAAWRRPLRLAADEAGLRLRDAGDAPPLSDHLPFAEIGIPAILLHTGRHSDYHQPTDTPDRLNHVGIARVARFTAALVQRLAMRSP